MMYIVKHMPTARQRVGKHIPTTQALSNRRISIISNGPIHARSGQEKTVFSVGSARSSYKKCSAGQQKLVLEKESSQNAAIPRQS
jgi:hypothetical protein